MTLRENIALEKYKLMNFLERLFYYIPGIKYLFYAGRPMDKQATLVPLVEQSNGGKGGTMWPERKPKLGRWVVTEQYQVKENDDTEGKAGKIFDADVVFEPDLPTLSDELAELMFKDPLLRQKAEEQRPDLIKKRSE
ncbi:MAG: hypothetical protein R3E39_32195 [Anaerolineae bacterium]